MRRHTAAVCCWQGLARNQPACLPAGRLGNRGTRVLWSCRPPNRARSRCGWDAPRAARHSWWSLKASQSRAPAQGQPGGRWRTTLPCGGPGSVPLAAPSLARVLADPRFAASLAVGSLDGPVLCKFPVSFLEMLLPELTCFVCAAARTLRVRERPEVQDLGPQRRPGRQSVHQPVRPAGR